MNAATIKWSSNGILNVETEMKLKNKQKKSTQADDSKNIFRTHVKFDSLQHLILKKLFRLK